MTSDQLFPTLPVLLIDDEQPWLRSLSLTLKEIAGINNVHKCCDRMLILAILPACLIM